MTHHFHSSPRSRSPRHTCTRRGRKLPRQLIRAWDEWREEEDEITGISFRCCGTEDLDFPLTARRVNEVRPAVKLQVSSKISVQLGIFHQHSHNCHTDAYFSSHPTENCHNGCLLFLELTKEVFQLKRPPLTILQWKVHRFSANRSNKDEQTRTDKVLWLC